LSVVRYEPLQILADRSWNEIESPTAF
jgi:hypothetical protein